MATHSVTQNDDVDDGGGGGWVGELFRQKPRSGQRKKSAELNLFIARGCRSYARRGKSVLNNFRALV